MIERLTIQNFKSVKELNLDCRRVNLFIGEPNTGKSNILEALTLFSLPVVRDIFALVRLNDLSNLFFENELSNEISIRTGKYGFTASYKSAGILMSFFENEKLLGRIDMTVSGQITGSVPYLNEFKIHPYFFKPLEKIDARGATYLAPPHGENLFFVLQTNKALRSLVSEFVRGRGFKLTLRQSTSEVEISKEDDNVLTIYPFKVVSDTLQRIIFYVAAIETNQDATLVFEEPESNVFPYYTKYLAEKIANSDTNQYFLTTHNPYFLQSVIEKTPVSDLAVNIVDMKNFETIVRPVSEKGIEEILNLGSDVFLNFDKVLEA